MLDACAAIFRALLYGGILCCAGTIFAARTFSQPQLSQYAIPIIRRSAWLAIVAALGGALILVLRLGGQFDEATLSVVLNSGFGAACGLQLAGATLVLASLDDPTAHAMRFANAALLTLSFALSGHAAAADLANGFVVFAHASAAAWWVGSLLLLRRACDLVDLANLAQAVRRFSAVAVVIVGVLVFAGVLLIRALLNFEQLPQLSPYEQWLATKIGVVAVVLSVAAFNKFRLTPRLMAGDGAATSALRKSINVELVLIGMVIAVTALLTTYTAPPEQSP